MVEKLVKERGPIWAGHAREVVRLYDEGLNITAIETQVGINCKTVRKILKQEGYSCVHRSIGMMNKEGQKFIKDTVNSYDKDQVEDDALHVKLARDHDLDPRAVSYLVEKRKSYLRTGINRQRTYKTFIVDREVPVNKEEPAPLILDDDLPLPEEPECFKEALDGPWDLPEETEGEKVLVLFEEQEGIREMELRCWWRNVLSGRILYGPKEKED